MGGVELWHSIQPTLSKELTSRTCCRVWSSCLQQKDKPKKPIYIDKDHFVAEQMKDPQIESFKAHLHIRLIRRKIVQQLHGQAFEGIHIS